VVDAPSAAPSGRRDKGTTGVTPGEPHPNRYLHRHPGSPRSNRRASVERGVDVTRRFLRRCHQRHTRLSQLTRRLFTSAVARDRTSATRPQRESHCSTSCLHLAVQIKIELRLLSFITMNWRGQTPHHLQHRRRTDDRSHHQDGSQSPSRRRHPLLPNRREDHRQASPCSTTQTPRLAP